MLTETTILLPTGGHKSPGLSKGAADQFIQDLWRNLGGHSPEEFCWVGDILHQRVLVVSFEYGFSGHRSFSDSCSSEADKAITPPRSWTRIQEGPRVVGRVDCAPTYVSIPWGAWVDSSNQVITRPKDPIGFSCIRVQAMLPPVYQTLLDFEERMGRPLHAGRDGDLFYNYKIRGKKEEPPAKTEAQREIEELLRGLSGQVLADVLAPVEAKVLRLLRTQVLAERPGLFEKNPSWIESAYTALLRQEFPKRKIQSLAEAGLAGDTFAEVLGSFVWKLQHEFGIPNLPPPDRSDHSGT